MLKNSPAQPTFPAAVRNGVLRNEHDKDQQITKWLPRGHRGLYKNNFYCY